MLLMNLALLLVVLDQLIIRYDNVDNLQRDLNRMIRDNLLCKICRNRADILIELRLRLVRRRLNRLECFERIGWIF